MSRPYRIIVRKTVREEVGVDDRATLALNLERILPEDRMKEVLGEILERHGWTRRNGTYEKRGEGGETTVCDLDTLEVVTTVEARGTIEEKVERTVRGDTWNWRAGREKTQAELDAEIAATRARVEAEMEAGAIPAERKAQAERDLRREAMRRLEAGEEERRQELNRIVLEVYAEALKEKARELGEIEQIHEAWRNEEEYELVIRMAE